MPPAPTQTPGTRHTHSRSALTYLQPSLPTSNHQLSALSFLGTFSIPAVKGFPGVLLTGTGVGHRKPPASTPLSLELAESDPEF